MNVRLLLILLVIATLLVASRRYRRIGGWCSGVLLVLLFWQLLMTTDNRPSPTLRVPAPSVATMSNSASAEQMHLKRIELSGTGAPWRLAGELENTSAFLVKAVKIRITRLRCASAELADGQCDILWQGEHSVLMDIEPGATSKFDKEIWTHTPSVRAAGTIRDRFLILSVQSRNNQQNPTQN